MKGIYKINKIIVLILVAFSIPFFCGIENVNAADDVSGQGAMGSIPSCSKKVYCLHNTVGLRITLVDSNGKRCNYNSSTKTYCGSSGKETKSVDYWFDASEVQFVNARSCLSFENGDTTKKTKFERNFGSDLIGMCKEYYNSSGKVHTMKNNFFPLNDTSGYQTFDGRVLKQIIKNISTAMSSINTNGGLTINDTSLAKFMTRIFRNATPGAYTDEVDNNKVYKLWDKKISGGGLYIQFEELLEAASTKNVTTSNGTVYRGAAGISAIGTVAEVSYIMNQFKTGGNGFKDAFYNRIQPSASNNYKSKRFFRQCIAEGDNDDCNKTYSGQGALISHRGWTGFYAGNTSDKPPGLSYNTNISIDGLTNENEPSKTQDLSVFYKKNAANIAHVWLKIKPTTTDPKYTCDDVVKEAVNKSSVKTIGDFVTAIKEKWKYVTDPVDWIKSVSSINVYFTDYSKFKTHVSSKGCGTPKLDTKKSCEELALEYAKKYENNANGIATFKGLFNTLKKNSSSWSDDYNWLQNFNSESYYPQNLTELKDYLNLNKTCSPPIPNPPSATCPQVAYDYATQPGMNLILFKNNIASIMQANDIHDDYTWMKFVNTYFSTITGLQEYLGQLKKAGSCSLNCVNAYDYVFKNTSDITDNSLNNLLKYSNISISGKNLYEVNSILSKILPYNSSNACKTYTCNDILTTIKNQKQWYSNGLTGLGITDAQYKESLNRMYNKFGYNGLNYDTISALGIEPSCDSGDIPDNCHANIEGMCDSFDLLTFSTSTDSNCITKGIAYSYGTAATLQGSSYTKYGNDVKCTEIVKFDFPGSVNIAEKVKSGTVLNWHNSYVGLDSDDKDSFGTMIITHDCYGSPSGTLSWKYSDTLIKTNIEMLYKPYGSSTISGDLVVEKDPYDTIISNTTNGFKIIGYFKIKYGKKLNWYSNKGSGKLSNEDNYSKISSDDVKKTYLSIGYGLPITFTVPDGEYKEENGLQLKISNIGVSKDPTAASTFDKFIATLSLDPYAEVGTKSYYYKCNYNVHNELFGNECCTTTGVKIAGAPSYCTCDGGETGGGSPKGLDVVFRTIDLIADVNTNAEGEAQLNRAFPGKSGNGYINRKIGKNWRELLLNNSDNVDTATITEGFKILNNKIYNKVPQYSFKLTSSGISKIREYNKKIKNSGKDPYSGIEYRNPSNGTDLFNNGYAGFVCAEKSATNNNISDYNYCASNLITQLSKNDNSTFKFEISCKNSGTTENRTYMSTTDRASKGPCGQKWYDE